MVAWIEARHLSLAGLIARLFVIIRSRTQAGVLLRAGIAFERRDNWCLVPGPEQKSLTGSAKSCCKLSLLTDSGPKRKWGLRPCLTWRMDYQVGAVTHVMFVAQFVEEIWNVG